jgi:hypothetical protein
MFDPFRNTILLSHDDLEIAVLRKRRNSGSKDKRKADRGRKEKPDKGRNKSQIKEGTKSQIKD